VLHPTLHATAATPVLRRGNSVLCTGSNVFTSTRRAPTPSPFTLSCLCKDRMRSTWTWTLIDSTLAYLPIEPVICMRHLIATCPEWSPWSPCCWGRHDAGGTPPLHRRATLDPRRTRRCPTLFLALPFFHRDTIHAPATARRENTEGIRQSCPRYLRHTYTACLLSISVSEAADVVDCSLHRTPLTHQ
jgi:hypothetical protein